MQDEITYKLLKTLEENPNQSQRQLSQSLGVSLGKTNYCLKALMERGLVKAGNFRRSERKTKYLYLLTPKGVETKAKVTLRFLQRKLSEYERLKIEIEQLQKEVV
ncbi:MAG: MarR family EPS-associated transcriptional regulator [Pseudohongiellaceae bacterium]